MIWADGFSMIEILDFGSLSWAQLAVFTRAARFLKLKGATSANGFIALLNGTRLWAGAGSWSSSDQFRRGLL